ncbi:MAG: YfhO family protein [Candidatus Izemoplasmatales bacterium]|nr:YfhO family protein [Candidatus Izemoplasmatales bacterium]
MKQGKIERKERLRKLAERFRVFMEDIFSSKKKTFLFLGALVFTILFVIDALIILINNSFYNNFSDDIIQYYAIMNDFIVQVKDGTISWFNLNNYLGASFFSDIYYVPLDIFTFITFLLSYVMPVELAYSATELIKILAGVMIFAYYLNLKGMKTRTIFWMGMVYFISGGSVSFMAFPVFLSLAFYLPLSLVVIHFFFHKKRWIVPLFALAVIFYDFYLGYMALAFISIMYLVEALKEPNMKLGRFLRDGAIFLGLLLLGVVMSAVILYPSILYILEDTYRPEGYFDSWNIDLGFYTLKLFQPTIYIRVLAKIFTEQKGIGFYGFENNYGQEHISLFITIVGFIYMTYIYKMKDRTARVYQFLIPFGLLLILFPIFSFVFSGTTDSPYTRWINTYPLVEVMILAHVFEHYGFEKVSMKYLTFPIAGLLLLDGFLMYYYIARLTTAVDFLDPAYWTRMLNTVTSEFTVSTNYISRDVMTADTVLMGVAAVILILFLVFGWLKKWKAIRTIFWVEFAIAIVYIYSGPFAIRNKIDTFEEMHSINYYLNDVLDSEDFFRVYVDLNRFDVEDLNFNRMTTFATNTQIFHSWTDSETNMIGYLLFGTWEYQSKSKLEVQAIYLNQFLGYKYVLVSAEDTYYLPSTYYQLVNANSQFKLYEIVYAEPFSVYESYVTYDEYRSFAVSSTKIAAQKVFLSDVLLDKDDDRFDFEYLNLLHATMTPSAGLKSITAYRTISTATEVVTSGMVRTAQRTFYRYDGEDWDIGFDAGAIYIKSNYMGTSAYGEVFMEFADGSRRACEISETTAHQVKCEFWSEPTAIYFEQTSVFSSVKSLEYRMERAIDGAAYLVYDMSGIDYTESEGMLWFSLSNSIDFERVFVVDQNGNETEGFNGYHYFDVPPMRMYFYKTAKMYEQSDLFTLSLRYAYDDLSYYGENAESQVADNQTISIDHSVIHLTYDRISDTTYDQIVVIPVAYSEEWQITSDTDYSTFSASGGFLGILIPNGTNHIDITLRFVPKGVETGLLASLGGVAVYTLLFLPAYLLKKKRAQASVENTEELN